jgi:hypothetical protein
MWHNILKYGVIAGVVVALCMVATVLAFDGLVHGWAGMALGYLTMLVALSAVFVGIKRRRDADLGGVIRFWPAFGMGLGISLVAGVFYVVAWEIVQAATQMDFATDYGNAALARERAKGTDAATLAKLAAEMAEFRVMYANPLFRLPMTFAEIFPVGVLVSLVSAALLRNPRFMPARG